MNIKQQTPKPNTVLISTLKSGDAFKAMYEEVESLFILTDEDWKAIDISDGQICDFNCKAQVIPLPAAEFVPNQL